jgi:hypothetical protein
MADEVVPGAVSDEAARGEAVGDLGREVERLTHTAGELQRLLELAIVDRDRRAGDAKRLTAERDEARGEVARHQADLAAAAGELLVSIPEAGTDAAKLLHANVMMRKYHIPELWAERDEARAERDALVEACIVDTSPAARPWFCRIDGSWSATRAEAVEAIRIAAGLGAAGEGESLERARHDRQVAMDTLQAIEGTCHDAGVETARLGFEDMVRRLVAGRDALIEMCIYDRTEGGRWPRGALGPWHCVVTGTYHETRAEAVAALLDAAGPGAAREGTRCGNETS